MADEDKIKYSDIIEPDDSIEKLVKQLEELNKSYETMVTAVKAGADRIVQSIKAASGATSEGRKAIDDAAASTSRLERAQKELDLALSDTGKQIAWLKAQTFEANRATVEQQRYIKQASSSYDRLKSDLKQAVELYKSLTAAEREDSAMGQQLLNSILNLKNQIKALDDQMRPHIQAISEVEKAEQKLAFLQSEEGKKLLELKAKIAELTSARNQQKASVDPLVQAYEKLVFASSKENEQLKLYSTLTAEANRIAKLNAQISNSAEGSYNRLAAQYELNKIKLNKMSAAEREAANSGKKLEAETNAIYQQMIKLQEATGNYRLSVGHYQKVWNGLGMSISQVVRELPAAAVSLNTFFLGISNNIPTVVDEINKLRLKNKQLQAEGKATVSVTKEIVKSLFSWNTALVVILTIFSMFGKQITEWITSIFKGKKAVMSMSEALSNITKELKDTNANYGTNIVSLKQLQEEWKNLKTTAEKNQFIKDNKTEFNKLGVAVNNVNDADRLFIENTQDVIDALKARAKAAAAQKLAAEKYEEALLKEEEAKNVSESEKLKSVGQFLMEYVLSPSKWTYSAETLATQEYKTETPEERLLGEAKAAEETADAYFELSAAFEAEAKARLKAAGLDEPHKGGRKKTPRDLTDTINKNDIKIQKLYEESITKLRNDEYAKRRKAAADEVQDANNKLREMYRKNVEYVDNVDKKYKKLTESQKKQIEQQQKWITETIANNLKLLSLQLQQIQNEQSVNALKIRREAINNIEGSASGLTLTTGFTVSRDTSAIEDSIVQERKLMEENLDLEYTLTLETNKKLLEAGDTQARSEEELLIELNKKKLILWSTYDKKIIDIRAHDIEDQLKLVKKGSEEELNLLLQQNEMRRQLALAENIAKPAEQQIDTSVINAQFNKYKAQIAGSFTMTAFEEQQKLDEAIFNEIKHNETEITRFKLEQEKDRWLKQIELAESGGLDWSDAQIKAAKSAVKGIERELSDLDFIGIVGKKGLGTALLESIGLDSDQIDAVKDAANIVIEQLKNIMQAEIELAEKAVEAAEKRAEAAQKAYDEEIEARNNGYANNVASAKRDLELEKKKQLEKQKLLDELKARQEAVDTVMQTSSLITASANLWKSFSGMGPFGPALAIAAIAAMWASFAAAKIKARQVASSVSDEYGEGGLEFLEGGSHASGNDIDLGIKNKKNHAMKAEGGEALAIINKKKTRKYRKILPDVIDSLNRGTFEDKYLNAFANTDGINVSVNTDSGVDISKIENDVRSIKKQGETKYYTLSNGVTVIQHKNVKRIIKY